MGETLCFVHASEQDSNRIAATYQLAGWNIVIVAPQAPDALEQLASYDPAAVVFCLDERCGPGVIEFAARVLADDRTNRPLMVFVDGSADDIATARGVAPYGIFVRTDELPWVLKRLSIKS